MNISRLVFDENRREIRDAIKKGLAIQSDRPSQLRMRVVDEVSSSLVVVEVRYLREPARRYRIRIQEIKP